MVVVQVVIVEDESFKRTKVQQMLYWLVDIVAPHSQK